ncbi:MAG: 4Fe-4S dicluster domain-containing protein [Lentisphaerales bacterium]|jgi:NAD-dependent dihydropyrimidine dehydrogenase PreA subunit|nr:MAG: 4Fe-4S dicluster domain-containing protein [Lentisphaerales bacterium]
MNYLRNVVTLELDRQKCVGCGMCAVVCPRSVLSVKEGKAVIKYHDACIECGACALNCPVEALSVDSGVGCARAFIRSLFTGSEPKCKCGSEQGTCC